jgi:hypothetical protein
MEKNMNDISLDIVAASKGENAMLKSAHNDSFFFDVEKDIKVPQSKAVKKKYFGHLYTFFFKNGEPLIVIGPHCIILLN